jgi:DNA/RNA endonuclease YhcR with UshA esterase domain
MHKPLLTTLFCFSVVLRGAAQQKITLEEVSKHINDSITVCGKIYGGKYLDAAKNQPTFLNMGATYPNQLLTIVIWGSTRKLFAYKPEDHLKAKEVCVTGKVELFKEKPQIIITQAKQLEVQ